MAEWLEWYQPEFGPGGLSDIVSHQPPVKAALREKSTKLALIAEGILDTVPEVRTGASRIGVKHGGSGPLLDSWVYLEDNTKGGAAAIELGTEKTAAIAPLRRAMAAMGGGGA